MRAASSGTTDEQLARKLKAPEKSQTTAAQPHSSRLPGSIGVVKTLNGDGTATVTFNGGDIPCQVLGDFYPVVGQSVLVLIEGERNWAIGPVSTSPSGWQDIGASLGYGSGWSDFGSGEQIGQYRMLGDMVQLRGVVNGPNTANSIIFTLPAGYAPTNAREFIVQGGSSTVSTVAVLGTGDVELGAVADGAGLWLDPIQFSVS